MADELTVRLTLDVTYIPNGVSAGDLKEGLDGLVERAFQEGLLSGYSEAEVKMFSHKVEVI